MSFDGRAVANHILDHCEVQGRGLTNLSLQKVIYFCHVWSLIDLNKPLVKHHFEAWKFGPVLQYLYREFKEFNNRPIKARAMALDQYTGEKCIAHCVFDEETATLITRVTDFYTRLTASDLIELSHVKGGPWDQVWNHKGRVNPGMKMDNKAIADFYSKIRPPFSVQ
jgi:uncharacterized phage-associated protein